MILGERCSRAAPHLWLGPHLWAFFFFFYLNDYKAPSSSEFRSWFLILSTVPETLISSPPLSSEAPTLLPKPAPIAPPPKAGDCSCLLWFWVRFSAPLTDPGGSRKEIEGLQRKAEGIRVQASLYIRIFETPVVGTCFMVKSEQEMTVHEVCPLYWDTPVVFSAPGCSRTLARPTHNATYLEISLSLPQDTHKPVTDWTHCWTDEQDTWPMYSPLPPRSWLVEEASTRRWAGFKMRRSSKWGILP